MQKEFLLKAAQFYERVPQDVARSRGEARATKAHLRAGRIYLTLGDYSRARQLLETSLTEFRQLKRVCPKTVATGSVWERVCIAWVKSATGKEDQVCGTNSRNRPSRRSPKSCGKGQTTQRRLVCWQSVTSCPLMAFRESLAIQSRPWDIFGGQLS